MIDEKALSDLVRTFMLKEARGKLTERPDGSLDDEDSNWGFDPADLSHAILSLIRPAFEAQQAKLAQAVEEEREACARVAERCALNPRGRRYSDFGAAREDIAEAIRVRSAASDIRGEKT